MCIDSQEHFDIPDLVYVILHLNSMIRTRADKQVIYF